jgi:hypothetical protein
LIIVPSVAEAGEGEGAETTKARLSSKLEKAKEKGIEIWTEAEWREKIDKRV